MIEFCCLITRNGRLNDNTRTLLYHLAHSMAQRGKEKFVHKNDTTKITVKTKGDLVGVGSSFGQKFNAVVEREDEERPQEVEYIVNTNKPVKNGFWASLSKDEIDQLLSLQNN